MYKRSLRWGRPPQGGYEALSLPGSPTIPILIALQQTDKAKQEVANAESKLEQYRKDAGKKIDAADRKVEEGAAKAKSGVSSWFGGK
jgi:hypothetical protein